MGFDCVEILILVIMQGEKLLLYTIGAAGLYIFSFCVLSWAELCWESGFVVKCFLLW